jgi:hypothetical protein
MTTWKIKTRFNPNIDLSLQKYGALKSLKPLFVFHVYTYFKP